MTNTVDSPGGFCRLCGRSRKSVRQRYVDANSKFQDILPRIIGVEQDMMCVECLLFMRNYFGIPDVPRVDVEEYKLMLSGKRPFKLMPCILEMAPRPAKRYKKSINSD